MERFCWVDLDGCLATYENWKGIHTIGEPFPGAKKFMHDLVALGVERGFGVGVFTVRTKLDMPGREILDTEFPDAGEANLIEHLRGLVVQWLRMHHIQFHEVYVGQGKPPGLAYIDDKGVWCCPKTMGAPEAYRYAFDALKGILNLGK